MLPIKIGLFSKIPPAFKRSEGRFQCIHSVYSSREDRLDVIHASKKLILLINKNALVEQI